MQKIFLKTGESVHEKDALLYNTTCCDTHNMPHTSTDYHVIEISGSQSLNKLEQIAATTLAGLLAPLIAGTFFGDTS